MHPPKVEHGLFNTGPQILENNRDRTNSARYPLAANITCYHIGRTSLPPAAIDINGFVSHHTHPINALRYCHIKGMYAPVHPVHQQLVGTAAQQQKDQVRWRARSSNNLQFSQVTPSALDQQIASTGATRVQEIRSY